MRGWHSVDGCRLSGRLTRLYLGLLVYGASTGLMVRAGLGTGPWDVLHQGVAERTGLSVGAMAMVTGAVVLLWWIPLRERPGLGTVSNVVLVGLAMDATMAVVPAQEALVIRIPMLLSAVALNGAATGSYISAGFGPGPRDGLMTGLHRVTGRSVRLVRTLIECVVLAAGFLLGGTAGVGTALYAVAIGPLSQLSLRLFGAAEPRRPGPEPVRRNRRGLGAACDTASGQF